MILPDNAITHHPVHPMHGHYVCHVVLHFGRHVWAQVVCAFHRAR